MRWSSVILGMGGALLALGPSCDKKQPAAHEQDREAAGMATPAATPAVRHRVFPGAAAALAEVLADDPRVIGFGEYHQTTATLHVPSALHRFTGEMLDVLGASVSDLIVETWVEDGACGKQEQQVGADVRETTERPPETGNEVLALAERARGQGIQPHALKLDCADYATLIGDGGDVDYEQLLALITRELRATTARVLAHRDQQRAHPGDAGMPGARRRIAVYGGSLHNDIYPHEALAMYSYAADIQQRTEGRYVEVDLYVPELIEGNELLAKEPWYPLLARQAGPDRVILIERGPGSYILILPRSR